MSNHFCGLSVSDNMQTLDQEMVELLTKVNHFLESGIFDPERAKTEKVRLAMWHDLKKELLDLMHGQSAELMAENYDFKYLINEVAPALVAMLDGNESRIQSLYKRPWWAFWRKSFQKKLKDYYAIGFGELGEKFGVLEKFSTAVQAVNHFLKSNAILVPMLGSASYKDFSIGVANLTDSGVWSYKNEEFGIYEGEMVYPVRCLPPVLGAWEPIFRLAWINRSACFSFAYSATKSFIGGFHDYMFIDFIRDSIMQYEAVHDLTEAVVHQTCCEEFKHALNYFRAKKFPGLKNEREILFCQERIEKDGLLKYFWQQCVNDEERHLLATRIEEANAKLTKIAFGPDPRLALTMMIMCLPHENSVRGRFPSEWEMTIAMLANRSGFMSENDFRYILSLDARILRLMAKQALEEIFLEDHQEAPFCRLNDDGTLYKDSNTHPLLARWV